ncbi:hypothetical protein ACTJJ4_03085 [Microbacterium sp. 22195]|uniref:hypothetical protein n=1 Tax=Microbacterium sp. 22195 TaxID=3453891 RepID=UPI003F85A84A
MAAGDDAIAKGFPIVTGSEAANTIDTEINITRDLLALLIRVSDTQPTDNLIPGVTLWARPIP